MTKAKEKTTNKNEEIPDESELAMLQMAENNQQLQETAQNLANQLQQYMALCSHYEQTINVLTGRVQELKSQIGNMNAMQQQNSQGN
jgi:PIN domain nuclease of toxin-antitoxin system